MSARWTSTPPPRGFRTTASARRNGNRARWRSRSPDTGAPRASRPRSSVLARLRRQSSRCRVPRGRRILPRRPTPLPGDRGDRSPARRPHRAAALVGSTAFRLSAAPGAPAEVLGDPLLHGLLERVVICDPRIEELLTAARRALLEAALAAPPAAKDGEERLSFLCSLAHQCFTNDYVYFVTEGEVPARRDADRRRRVGAR